MITQDDLHTPEPDDLLNRQSSPVPPVETDVVPLSEESDDAVECEEDGAA